MMPCELFAIHCSEINIDLTINEKIEKVSGKKIWIENPRSLHDGAQGLFYELINKIQDFAFLKLNYEGIWISNYFPQLDCVWHSMHPELKEYLEPVKISWRKPHRMYSRMLGYDTCYFKFILLDEAPYIEKFVETKPSEMEVFESENPNIVIPIGTVLVCRFLVEADQANVLIWWSNPSIWLEFTKYMKETMGVSLSH